jgi:aminopeptidase N
MIVFVAFQVAFGHIGSSPTTPSIEIDMKFKSDLFPCLAFVLLAFVNMNLFAQRLPHSFARPDEAAIQHLHLDLKVDFETQKLTGTATLTLRRRAGADQLYLDTNGLDIFSVKASDGTDLKWALGNRHAKLGQPLIIALPAAGETVIVSYASRPSAEAVQWLTPEQTTDKQQPFLFTQSQAILARTWVPCQDTPAVRMTYSARIQVPPQLLAVMSASNPQTKNGTGLYDFEMKQPIPSYLLALAVGDLEFAKLGPRCGVYAERSVVKKAVWELHDTERMILAAEELYGAYRWERYDVIFLPSSFPFGGMENPRLTFATPTILAGDRSLVSLIAHELAHSWSGNLVTNATWNDFWLNEGFTVYFEQRIMEAIYGRAYAEMLARLSLDGLLEDIKELKPRDTWLKLDLAGRSPDDGMTSIAYDKGYFFLRMLEEQVGREKWDSFLRTYFEKFAFQSMTTEKFLAYLEKNLKVEVDFNAWIYSAGLPDNCPVVKTEELTKVAAAAAAFSDGRDPARLSSDFNTKVWTTHHWNHFLRSFKTGLTAEQMTRLDAEFKFTGSGNSEITHDWLLHVIRASYEPGMEKLEAFLTGQGRRKFLQPLYEELAKSKQGTKLAHRIYSQARSGYHAVSRQTIDQILGVAQDEK